MTSEKANILIAEDDPVLANVVATWLEESGFNVHTVSSGKHAEMELIENDYDLMVLDLGLPELEGKEVLLRARARQDQLPILISTARDSLSCKIAGLNAGADDYLTKPFELAELEARIRALLRRKSARSENIISCGALKVDRKQKVASVHGDIIDLSPTEFEVLELLVVSAGEVVTRSSIGEAISQGSEPLSENAIEVYVHRLRKKLDFPFFQIKTVRGIGYTLGLPSNLV